MHQPSCFQAEAPTPLHLSGRWDVESEYKGGWSQWNLKILVVSV